MNNKIAVRLTAYFSAALLIFSVIIGIIFISLFKNNVISMHKIELENRAANIAEAISQLAGSSHLDFGRMHGRMGGMMDMQGGLGSYLRNLDTIAMDDAWIVDENLNLLTTGTMSNMHYSYTDLPGDANVVVKDVFKGETTFSEGFSKLLNTPAITVGTPIISGNEIIGALLIRSPVEGIDKAAENGCRILLISIFIALVLSFALSAALASAFAKPLKSMKKTALILAEGNYAVKTGVKRDDEIGELASTIDLLSQRLEEAGRESEMLQKQRQDFITNISHELRTPVTVIRGSLEALCDGIVHDPERVEEYHLQMLNESKGLERLVNDLLELSRLQNTDFSIEIDEINLGDILKDAIRSASNIGRHKNITIEYISDRDIFFVKGDYGRLRQMLMIIIDNAIKFSYENSRIQVSLDGKTVEIKDEGTGISENELPHIFDRYYSAAPSGNKSGTGLGLTIAKQIALRHNIEVSVFSEQGKGTAFTFKFA